ncbi:MAG TPA: hypothetical protein VNT32_07200 [Thermoleophilaceae bacterium]|nr:hypothetical protein [Thermoleophilaceae bacterium]
MRRIARNTRRVGALAGALAGLTLAASATPATGSAGMQSIVMDDAEIVYASPERLDATMAELKAIGVDRVRVSVYWRLIAPQPERKERPSFGPAGPASPAGYPADHWDRYDRIVVSARKHGIGLLFSLTGPSPLWATGSPERRDIEETYEPNPDDFRSFAEAVGRRYSGEYREETQAPPPSGGGGLLGGEPQQQPAPQGELIPRVDTWSVWNEPNHPGWLTPQWLPDPRAATLPLIPVAGRLYRGLVDAAWDGLARSGHASDNILLGETAPRGHPQQGLTRAVRPLEFIRELYCVDRRLRPYQGEDAQVRGCPGSRQAMVEQHPGLFASAGWAHHPYALEQAPGESDDHRDNAVLADTDRLVRTLDKILGQHGQSKRFPIWMTEYGYQTDPPDPTLGIPWSRQAAYLNEAEHIAYRNPRIASSAQFLLVDDGPLRQFEPSDPRYWGTFQSGLKTGAGRQKHAYAAYQRVIDVTRRVRRGRSARIFGQFRPAADGEHLTARLEYRRRGSRRWSKVRTLSTTNPKGFLRTTHRPRGTGYYRLIWIEPGSGRELRTRSARVTVLRARARR